MSELTVVEMRCLFARRRREREIDSKIENQVFAVFKEDMRHHSLISHPLPDGFVAVQSISYLFSRIYPFGHSICYIW